MPQSLVTEQEKPRFTRRDTERFEKLTSRVSWTAASPEDQQGLREIRSRLQVLSRLGAQEYPGEIEVRDFVSVLNPNGATPRDYWCCIFPSAAHNKSFGLQVALIIRAGGAELCFGVGSGTSQERDHLVLQNNLAALNSMRSRLATMSTELVENTAERLGGRWDFRRHWRQAPGSKDFDSLQAWIRHAASQDGAEAVVSRNYSAEALEERGAGITDDFLEAVRLFAPILDAAYRDLELTAPAAVAQPASDVTRRNDLLAGKRVWAIGTGEGGYLWPEFLENGLIGIGARGLRESLLSYQTIDDLKTALRPLSDPGIEPRNEALCCYEFSREISVGDVLLAKRGQSTVLGIGTVLSDYAFDATRTEYPHVRKVKWTATGPWSLPEDQRVPLKTLTEVTTYQRLLEFIFPAGQAVIAPIAEADSDSSTAPLVSNYTIDDAIEGLFMGRDQFAAMVGALGRKRNLIIEGAPGTGKTFIARRIAYALLGRKDRSRTQMIQFHQSYSYEDFIQGWRPSSSGGFAIKSGVFYEFCLRAKTDPGSKYVFIIDEINRGNLSKIFGELLMLIEADKRSKEFGMPLMYSSKDAEAFFVPDNVHIIGLMNTADRSLAMVDYALRRRFAFARLEPAFASRKFRDYLIENGAEPELADSISEKMLELNEVISGESKQLGPGFEIGHSFFCSQDTETDLDETWFRSVVSSEIEPLLREYWFDQPSKVEDLVDQLLR